MFQWITIELDKRKERQVTLCVMNHVNSHNIMVLLLIEHNTRYLRMIGTVFGKNVKNLKPRVLLVDMPATFLLISPTNTF